MANAARKLSNLEAAILAEIEHLGPQTAFQVRRSFADSVSLEWKGSAGAVYPAVARLGLEGLILTSEPVGGRKTRTLSLTRLGKTTLEQWATDAGAASSVGVDPFRMRAGLWAKLPRNRQKALLLALEREIRRDLEAIDASLQSVDRIEAVRVDLARQVQLTRLAQIKVWQERGFDHMAYG